MCQPVKNRKVMAYVDGYNLYYGLVKTDKSLRWLDLPKMLRMLMPWASEIKTKYFTAAVDDHCATKTPRRIRQEEYWRALKTVDVELIFGKMEFRDRACLAHHCSYDGPRSFRAPVEKMTDVNMALHIVDDAINLKPDVMCIISGDTDLLPAMKWVMKVHRPCRKLVYIPCKEEDFQYRRVDEFGLNGWQTQRLKEEVLVNCRLPELIEISGEVPIKCPTNWGT